jgi:hypothetical protein
MSPTARTLKWLRDLGYIAGVVERTLPKCFIKVDLFGWCDIVAVPTFPPMVGSVYIQTTSETNHSGRKRKILDSDTAKPVLEAGNRILVVSWRQSDGKGGRWTAKSEEITLAMFGEVAATSASD